MNDQGFPHDFAGLPADMKMLETLISDMHGHKRGYVSEKIKHYQELLKRSDSIILVRTMSSSCRLSPNLILTSQ
jgi:pantothenate kinase-related protein Tda10